MSIIVRPAMPDDLPVLLDLWLESWTALMPEIDFAARLPWFTGYLADLRRDGADLLVAETVDGPVGFVTVDPVTGEMAQLVTARAAQRRGVGRRLVGAAKARAPAGLALTVLQGNAPALELYRAEGFVVTGEGLSLRSSLPTFHMRWGPAVGDGAPHPEPLGPALSAEKLGSTGKSGPV